MVDVMLVLDRSGSMNGPPAVTARTGAESLLDQLDPVLDQSGVRSFPSVPLDKGLDHDHDASKEAVRYELPAGLQSTGTDGQAQRQKMQQAHQDIDAEGRAGAFKAMVVISDGLNDPKAYPAAGAAQQAGIKVFSIAVGESADGQHMSGIASRPKEIFYHHVNTSNDARAAMQQVIDTVTTCGVEVAFGATIACAPGTVTFEDRTRLLGDVTAIAQKWEFGDGQASSASVRNTVVHIYEEPGTYLVNLTVRTDLGLAATYSAPIEVPPCPPVPPEPAFRCSQDALDPRTVHFRDLSQKERGTIEAWHWDLADGEVGEAQHFQHAYNADGEYMVSLTVTDSDGLTGRTTRLCYAAEDQPPVLINVRDVTVHEGERVTVAVHAVVPMGGDPVVHVYGPELPDHANIWGDTLDWITREGDAGEYGPFYAVATHKDRSAQGEFWVTVLPMLQSSANDEDDDGIHDDGDNCPAHRNPGQEDRDGDHIGDACDDTDDRTPAAAAAPDADRDRDGIVDRGDNCPDDANPTQEDLDWDGQGDACDLDRDGDRVPDVEDNCPAVPNPGQADRDDDGTGDDCTVQEKAAAQHAPRGKALLVRPESRPEDVEAFVAPLALAGIATASLTTLLALFVWARRR